MKTEKAQTADGKTVEFVPTLIGEGGMKQVFFTADKTSVLCFYKDQGLASDQLTLRRLAAILDAYNPTADPKTGSYFSDLFCWPTGIIVRPLFGIITPAYPANFFFASGKWQGKEKNGKWFSVPKLRARLPAQERGDLLSYLMLCIQMARAVRKMHLMGLAHSDLSCSNVLLDPPGQKAIIIDIDSLVVPGVYPPDVLGTPGYIAPEVVMSRELPPDDPNKHLPCNRTDQYALAVLIYEYLLRRHPLKGPKVNSIASSEEDEHLSMGEKALFIENPRDRSNRPGRRELKVGYEQLGPYLRELFDKAFVDGLHNPAARPTAASWESALSRTTDLLIPCGNGSCEEKWFVYVEGEKPKCPFCGWTLTKPIPVLDLHYAPRKGQFRPEGHRLVAWHQRRLHEWHVFRNKRADENSDKSTKAYVVFHQGDWLLVNKDLDSLISASGNPVPAGQATPLLAGSELMLSKDQHGRMITVKMIP